MEVGEVGGGLRGDTGDAITSAAGALPPELLWLLLFASAADSAVPRTLDGCFWEDGSSCGCWVWGGTEGWSPAPTFVFAPLK